tara:strand:+ start:107 stop:1174 length:1068 start_codon:yes stop_codon:yes gene_type:complete
MAGGLLQLVAYGSQDIYLTGNPQITFFKAIYRRHTNFSIESIQQSFSGNVGYGKRITCQLSRNGDLVHKVYLVFTSGKINPFYSNYLSLNNVEIEIGGQIIDKHYKTWMIIWNELTLPIGKKNGFNEMIGKTFIQNSKIYIPLEFWFCRNIGLALPLIALQYHEVKINITFDKDYAVGFDLFNLVAGVEIWADYIFLDTDERRRFAQLSHEYLIEQVQNNSYSTTTNNIIADLHFNHPVKELIWFGCGNYSKAKLMLNGIDRFAERDQIYFTHIQPYQHHTNIPNTHLLLNGNINLYSFALKPEEHQPSGTLNMSRIDTAQLHLKDIENKTVSIYALSYNILRVMSGMGGLVYSN